MIQDWLIKYAPGYNELSEEEKQEIMQFSLLWSLFEAQVLNTSASPNSIKVRVSSWAKNGLLQLRKFEKYREYFSRRYIENGNPTHRFQHLHLRRNDDPDLVLRVLKYETDEISDVVTALLIIVYRYRNNFFHGIKWAYQFQDQLDNFKTSNGLLVRMLEIKNQHGNQLA